MTHYLGPAAGLFCFFGVVILAEGAAGLKIDFGAFCVKVLFYP